MRRALSVLVVLAALVLLGFVLLPFLRNAVRLADLLRAAPPTAGSLQSPLPGQRFVDTFGAPRGGGRRHAGVDIFAPRGTPIRATAPGVVVQAGDNSLGGHTVTLLGSGGWRHYYAHLDRPTPLRVGALVAAGEVVGLVGNSGNARTTPSHLHYGVYARGGAAVNPYPLLRR